MTPIPGNSGPDSTGQTQAQELLSSAQPRGRRWWGCWESRNQALWCEAVTPELDRLQLSLGHRVFWVTEDVVFKGWRRLCLHKASPTLSFLSLCSLSLYCHMHTCTHKSTNTYILLQVHTRVHSHKNTSMHTIHVHGPHGHICSCTHALHFLFSD